MNSGFVTHKHVIKRLGIHQRFDSAAYHMIEPYLPAGFPTLADIVSFEGYNGPDGLKVKSPGVNEPSHLYDPIHDVGQVPSHIQGHYENLVLCLKTGDAIRGAFEASWMAHYICDGLTPAHHWPLEDKIAEAASGAADDIAADTSRFTASLKKNWAVWGIKGHLSTHFYFETGILFALMAGPVRASYSDEELAKARQLGAVEYFKAQARDIAELNLYEQFYREGWTTDLATRVKTIIAPRTAKAIGIIWLLALLDAGEQLAKGETVAVQAAS